MKKRVYVRWAAKHKKYGVFGCIRVSRSQVADYIYGNTLEDEYKPVKVYISESDPRKAKG